MTVTANVNLTETAEGAFLLDRVTGDCFALNKLGLQIWHRLSEGRSQDDIVAALADRFSQVSRDVIARDVAAFVEALSSRSLLAN